MHFQRETDLIILHAYLLIMSKLECQYPGCTYTAEHASEAVAIAYLTSHNNVHATGRSHTKHPTMPRPELKQDITAEEWYSFVAEWNTYKRINNVDQADIADNLYQCCDRPLARLLLKENPNIVEEGEVALLAAMQKMAVLQVAVNVRRAKLLTTTQEPGQSFCEFYANIRSSASTCEYIVKCPHTCCTSKDPIDYTP